MKPKFGTVYDRYQHFTDPGSEIHVKYSMQLSDDGVYELVPTGTENWHDIINASFESCNLDSILQRYKDGDPDVLNQRAVHFGDFTEMPHNQFEIYRNIRNGESNFDHLPIEIKEKFDYSFDKFVSMIGTPAWFDYMNLTEKVPFVPEESEVTTDGQKQ